MRVAHVGKVAEDNYTLSTYPCPSCKEVETISIDGQHIYLFNRGASIQEVLPNESLDTRERFLSGYCATCWDAMFPDEEAED